MRQGGPIKETSPRQAPRQKRAQATRERILAAALVAFSERGHDGVNLTADILEPAGVSVGSFYHQFSDKTELLLAVLDAAADERADLVARIAGGLPPDPDLPTTLRTTFTTFLHSLDDDRHLWRIQLRERQSTDPRVRKRVLAGREVWVDQLSDLLADRAPGDRGRIEQGATMIVNLSFGLATLYLDMNRQERSQLRDQLADDAVTFAIGGLEALVGPVDRT